jgi:cytochrome oxidase Cu insertion factor (SCO1/SenC/PrrC family)
MKISSRLFAGSCLLAMSLGSAAAATHLKVGDMAPDFTLPSTTGKPIHLADYRGKKNVVLAFFVLAFTGG